MDGYLSFKFMGKNMYLTSTNDENIVFSEKPEKFVSVELIQKMLFPFCEITEVEEKKKQFFVVVNKDGDYFTKNEKFSDDDFLEFTSFEFAKETAKKFNGFVIPINFKLDVTKNGKVIKSFLDHEDAIRCCTIMLVKRMPYDQETISINWVDHNGKIIVTEDPTILIKRMQEEYTRGFNLGKALSARNSYDTDRGFGAGMGLGAGALMKPTDEHISKVEHDINKYLKDIFE